MPEASPSPFAFAPLLPATACFILGLALGRTLPLPAGVTLLVAIIALAAYVLTESNKIPAAAHAFLAIALLAAGAVTYRLDQHYIPANHLLTSPLGTHTLLVRVASPPVFHPNPRPYGPRFSTAFLADALTIDHQSTTGTIAITLPDQYQLQESQTLILTGTLELPSPPRNPGEFDYPAYLAASRIFLTCRGSKDPPTIDAPAALSVHSAVDAFRLLLRTRIFQSVDPLDDAHDTSANTMIALFLGHRDPRIASLTRAFALAGGAHLLAISGTHVILVAGLLYYLVRPFTRRPRTRLLLVAILIALYILATPGGTPVLRAGTGLVLVALSLLLGRKPQILNLLSLALLVLLFLRPADLVDPGTQLSFATTFGLLLFAQPIYHLLCKKYLDRQAAITRAQNSRFANTALHIQKTLAGLLVANAVGLLIATPLTMYHFHQINPLAIFTGIILLPIVAVAITLSMAQLLLALCSTTLATLFAHISVTYTEFTIATVRFIANLPGSSMCVRSPPIVFILATYALLLAFLFHRHLPRFLSRATLTVLASFLLTATCAWYTLTAPPAVLTLHTLNVGRGHCSILQTADGFTVILNAGSPNQPALALRTIDPFLRHLGIARPNAILAIQLDPTHASAVPSLLSLYRHVPLLIPAIKTTDAPSNPALLANWVPLSAQLHHSPVVELNTSRILHLTGSTSLTALWPPPAADSLSASQATLILRLTTPRHTYILLDPASTPALAVLLATGHTGKADAILALAPAGEELQSLATLYHIPIFAPAAASSPLNLPD